MTTRLALIAALMLATTTANAQAPRPRQAPASAPAAAKAPAGQQAQPGPQAQPNSDASDSARIHAFSLTPFYQGVLKRAFDTVPPEMLQRCPTLVSGASQLFVLRPIRYDGDFPVAGVWKHSFPLSGCGGNAIINFIIIATPDKQIKAILGLPGNTHADPALQHGSATFAFNGVINMLHEQGAAPCPAYGVSDTKFEGFGLANPPTPDPGPAERNRPWWESWTVLGCGRTFLVPMNFVPQGDAIQVTQPGHVVELTPGHPVEALSSPAPAPLALSAPSPNPPAAGSAAALSGSAPADPPLHLPGTTLAGPPLQRLAQTRVFAAAATVLQEQGGTPCPTYTITNTKFEAYGLANPPTPDPGGNVGSRPWWESWTVTGCGRNFLVPLNFIPNGNVIDIVQPGHVTQPPLVDPSETHNPYATDDPPSAPPAAKP